MPFPKSLKILLLALLYAVIAWLVVWVVGKLCVAVGLVEFGNILVSPVSVIAGVLVFALYLVTGKDYHKL